MAGVSKSLSAMAALRANPAIRKSLDKAKVTPPGGVKYEGPDGELVCRLASNKVASKGNGADKYTYAVLEFRVIEYDGQDEYVGQKCTLFFEFKDNARGSIEENMGYYFEALSKSGVDTSLDDDAIDAAITDLVTQKTPIVVTAKWKGEHINFFVKEPLEGGAAPASEGGDEAVTWSSLGTAADDGDEEAATQLRTAATESGLNPDDGAEYPSWYALGVVLDSMGQEDADAAANGDPDTVDYVVLGQQADGEDAESIRLLTEAAIANDLNPNDGDTYPSWEALGEALSALLSGEGGDSTGDLPSAHDGLPCTYDGNGPYWVANPDDEAGTFDLIDENSDVIYEGIVVGDEFLVFES